MGPAARSVRPVSKIRFYQRVRANNDPSGNPQRLYVEYNLTDDPSGDPVNVWDEGYRGCPESLRGLPELPSVSVAKSEYHAWVREAKGRGVYRTS